MHDLEAFLPLRTAWFHILLALGNGARHGYAIRADVEERTQGRVKLWPATLYGSIRELSQEGFIAEVDGDGADGDDDPRRRYYALTELGTRVLEAEVGRLAALVDAARATQALGRA